MLAVSSTPREERGKVWNRKKFKGTAAQKRKINLTRVPIEGKESMRWLPNLRQSTELLGEAPRCIHVADCEGDIWELFCLARELDTHFLVRCCVERRAGDGSDKVYAAPWYGDRPGGSKRERQLWNMRAALVDCFVCDTGSEA